MHKNLVKIGRVVPEIAGYNAFRRDHGWRKGGGVAAYVNSAQQAIVWRPSADDNTFELLWIRISHTQRYGLRPRVHDRTLPERSSNFVDCNFIIKMLYLNAY